MSKFIKILIPVTIKEAKGSSTFAKGKIMALTGLKGRLQRMGLVTNREKEKGATGMGGVQEDTVANVAHLLFSHPPIILLKTTFG